MGFYDQKKREIIYSVNKFGGKLTVILKLLHSFFSIPAMERLQHKLFDDYKPVKKELAAYLGVFGRNILDVGCSGGFAAENILSMKDNRYVGIDINKVSLNRANKRLGSDASFLNMDAKFLGFKDESFDLILFLGVLHHFDDPLVVESLKQVKRVLRKNGHLLITEPVFSNSWVSNTLLRFDRGNHIRTAEGYRKLLTDFHFYSESFVKRDIHKFCYFVLTKG